MKLIGDQILYSLSLFPSSPLTHLPLSPIPPKNTAAFATLTCHRKTSTEYSAPQDQLELGSQVQTARAPVVGERWPVLRRADGDRSTDSGLRRAVAQRDGWACRICHQTNPPHGWEIDHIIPWSAGGEDVSTNLRLTCKVCNQRRSNYADPFARPMPAIIDICPEGHDESTGVRVWCNYHRHWLHVPERYIARHELGAKIARAREPEDDDFTAWLAGRLKEEIAHIEAAKTAAAEALTAWQRKEVQ